MLTVGKMLGPYRILGPLGAGGMGEVYRAHDTRLGRDVAVKVLPSHLAATSEVRARFEREARTISQLNHPHICTLHDVGHEDGIDYLVMELLEGETLAHRIEKGPLPVAEVLLLGRQIAEALDRAHRAGVVHRDLKPGNIMLTRAGAKLMDFGLARAHAPGSAGGGTTQSPTVTQPLTAEGTIVGTFQYMAPEQLEGKDADARSDIWGMGCVLYEMVTGARAFAAGSQASLIAAIMDRAPRPMTDLQPVTPPALERIVTHCLEKSAEDRFQSAGDLAFNLAAVSGAPVASTTLAVGPAAPTRRRFGSGAMAAGALLGALLIAAVGLIYFHYTQPADPSRVAYTRLTIQRGAIRNARFSPDAKTVLYSAAWDGHPPEIYETRPGFPTSRALGVQQADLLAISRNGTIAVKLGQETISSMEIGTLAEVSLTGGAARQILADVQGAEWLPDGKTLAVAHRVGGKVRLEMPPGHVLYETAGGLSSVRVSRDGERVVFVENPVPGDARGSVVILDATGRAVARTKEWNSQQGLAWSADDREVWFSASQDYASSDIRAMSRTGREHVVARLGGIVLLQDIARNGEVLLQYDHNQIGIRGQTSSVDGERELGWFDFPVAWDISADGRTLLFAEEGMYGGPLYAVCLRGMDGSPPVRLGEGEPFSLSPDGKWALAVHFGPPPRLLLLPTGLGESVSLPRGNIDKYYDARWLPDGKSIVFSGSEAGHEQRTYRQDLGGGLPRPLTPEGIAGTRVSPDGRLVVAVSKTRRLYVYPISGGKEVATLDLAANESPCQWSSDGLSLYVQSYGPRMSLSRIELATGKKMPWRTFSLPDPAGTSIFGAVITPDGGSYAYTYFRTLSDLYLVDGLK